MVLAARCVTDRRESHHLDSSLMCSGWRSHWERHLQPPQYVGGRHNVCRLLQNLFYLTCFAYFLVVFLLIFSTGLQTASASTRFQSTLCCQDLQYSISPEKYRAMQWLGNCLALYFWRSLKCLSYSEAMHWWPHALAAPQSYSVPNCSSFNGI